MRRLDLRLRLTAAISVVCIAIVAVLGGTLYFASERMELALVEQLVAEELDFLVQRYEADPNYVPSPGPNVEYYIFKADEAPANLPRFMRDLGIGHYEIDIGKGRGERDVVVRQVGDRRFAVVYNIGPYEQRETAFKHLVISGLAVVVALAVLLGYLLSGFLTRQLSLLAYKVSTLKPDQPYESLLRDEQDHEVAALARVFDEYHELFLAMIKREQQFTANVSHELRTPLTAIRTSCELLQQDSSLSDKARTRVRNILQATTTMADHTEALLLLARGKDFDRTETFALREFVEEVLMHFRDQLARKGLRCEIEIAQEVTLNTNRQALRVVLNNLLGNAIAYTESGFLRVSFEHGKLSVKDSGPGIAADQLSHIFERSYRGIRSADGLGLGLDIVRRVCEQAGWAVEAASELGVGSEFSIGFHDVICHL